MDIDQHLIFEAYAEAQGINAYEIEVHWANKYGNKTGIVDHTWRGIAEPTEDDLRQWIADKWEGNEILSNANKADIPDPMNFTWRSLGVRRKGEDRSGPLDG